MEAVLLAVDSQTQVCDVQIACAAQGADDGDGRTCLVASYRGIWHQAARCGGYFRGSGLFGGLLLPLSVFTLY